MSWRIVYISEAEEMRLYLDNLKVIKADQEVLIPLSDIHTIVVDNNRTIITSRLINKLTNYHILLVFCDEQHHPNAFSLGLYSHYRVYGVLQQQIAWSDYAKGMVWKKIVERKIQNQASLLEYLDKSSFIVNRLQVYAKEVEFNDHSNREGHAAKLYFDELFGSDFQRQRGAVDAYNSALNYGYIVLRACVARSVVAHGLHPSLGVGHRNQFNAFNLVDDCMEVFRPVIDFWVATSMEREDYLTWEIKQSLIRRLSAKILIDGQRQTVLNAIDIFIQSFIKAMNEEDESLLVYPENGIAL